MSAVLDEFTGQVDPGLESDAALERRINTAFQRMIHAKTNDEDSLEFYSEWCRLIWQRSKTKQIKLEIERMQSR